MWPKNGVFTDILTMDNSKTPVTFIAKVCYDPLPSEYYDWRELNWTAISNIVTVTPQCLGSVELPALTVTESAVRGEFLPVTVSGGQADAEYQLVIRNANNEWIDSYYVYRDDPEQEETVMLSTARLTAGVPYHISVDANPIPGYESAADSGKANTFTVSAPEEGLHVHYTATEVPFEQTVRAAAVAPGADMISVEIQIMGKDGLETVDEWADEMDNITVWLDYSTWRVPTLYVTFSACYDEEWENSETTQVSFLAEGALEKPAFTVSRAVTDFSDIQITVEKVEHAKNYYLDICRLFIYEDGEIDYEYADFASVEPGTFTLTADMLEDGGEYLVPGWVYALVLNVYGDNYYPSISDVRTAPRVIVTEPGTLMRLPAGMVTTGPGWVKSKRPFQR